MKASDPTIEVIGVQVAACAPYAHRLPPSGPVVTLADGIAVKRPGEITRPLVEQWLDDVVVVEENAVAEAMVLLMERAKLFVEGAGAVGCRRVVVATARTGTDRRDLRRVEWRQRRPRDPAGPDPSSRDPGGQTPDPVRPDQ